MANNTKKSAVVTKSNSTGTVTMEAIPAFFEELDAALEAPVAPPEVVELELDTDEFSVETQVAPEVTATPETLHNEYYALTPFDAEYPVQLRELGNAAPDVMFFRGYLACLGDPMVAVCTKGNANMPKTARKVAGVLAESGATLLIGGYRESDLPFIEGAIEHGGRVVIFIHHGIKSAQFPPIVEEAIKSGHCIVLSATFPRARYSQEAASRRNQLITTMASAVVALQVTPQKGSWDLCRHAINGKTPLYVPALPEEEGNRLLLATEGVHLLTGNMQKAIAAIVETHC